MPKKIILDVDPGFVDAIAMSFALFDPEVEVVAVTSVGGNVAANIAARNTQAIIEFLDPPRIPRLGIGSDPDKGLPIDTRHVHGIDGLCGTSLPVARLRVQHPAEKVICDAVRANPGKVSIICLAPLTNVARAFQRDPELPQLVNHIYIQGGTFEGPGNITPAAEFNMFCDPCAAKTVFQAACHKTVIPLDATNPVLFTLGMLERLPAVNTKLGELLYSILLPGFRAYRQCYGLEGLHVHDLLAYIFATQPIWFQIQEAAGDVETEGTICAGMTVFDRRRSPQWKNNMDIVVQIDQEPVWDYIMLGLDRASKIIEKA